MSKQQHNAPSKQVQVIILLVVMVTTSTIFGCREKPAEPVVASSAPVAASRITPATPATSAIPATPTRSKQQAMAALMALPELQAWSHQLEKTSGGSVHGALIEYDSTPRLINGKRYFQLSFVENTSAAAQRWESFLVAEAGDEILIEDGATDQTLTLAQWRATKRPLERTSAQQTRQAR